MPVPERLKNWYNHLMKVKAQNPDKTLKQAMIIAKKSYKK